MIILTEELINKDTPLSDFVILNKPYPNNSEYWPIQEIEVDPYCFLKLSEPVIVEIMDVFDIYPGHFCYYDLVNYSSEFELFLLIDNLKKHIVTTTSLSPKRFSLIHHKLKYLVTLNKKCYVSLNTWKCVQQDIVEILSTLVDMAMLAKQTGKTLSIVGV